MERSTPQALDDQMSPQSRRPNSPRGRAQCGAGLLDVQAQELPAAPPADSTHRARRASRPRIPGIGPAPAPPRPPAPPITRSPFALT